MRGLRCRKHFEMYVSWGSSAIIYRWVKSPRTGLHNNFRVDSWTDFLVIDLRSGTRGDLVSSTIMMLRRASSPVIAIRRRYSCRRSRIERHASIVLILSELGTVICNSADERVPLFMLYE